jgi:hypothetical protein
MMTRLANDGGVMVTLRDRLADGKYTKKFSNLSDDELAGLLWLVGEFAVRASATDYRIEDARYRAERRKIGALRAIVDFHRAPMGVDDVRRYIRDCLNQDDTIEIPVDFEGVIHLGTTSAAEMLDEAELDGEVTLSGEELAPQNVAEGTVMTVTWPDRVEQLVFDGKRWGKLK